MVRYESGTSKKPDTRLHVTQKKNNTCVSGQRQQTFDQLVGSGCGTKYTSLFRHHGNCRGMIGRVGRRGTIFQQQTFVSHVVSIPHGGMNTDI